MAKKKPVETPSGGDILARLESLEKAFHDLTGVGVKEYQESEAENPVIETKDFDSSVIRVHKDGKLEFLKKCPYCGAPVSDLALHKTHCSKRPIF